MDQALISSQSSSTSTSQLICFVHQWTIDNYPQVDAFYSPGQCLTSSQFGPTEDNQIRFSINLYPKGRDDCHTNWLSVLLKCDSLVPCPDEPDGRTFTYKVSLINEIGQLVKQCVGQSKFKKESCFGFTQFLDRDDLFSASNVFLPNHKLSLHCEISYLLNESIQTLNELQAAQRQIVSNLSSLLQIQTKCKISFQTSDGVIVKGHRCILLCASKIFERMLDTKSKYYKHPVELSDVSSEVFREVLNFIYTGKVHRLDKHKIALLLAAEKFQLDLLRSICADHIRASLPPEEVHQILFRMPLAVMPDVCLLTTFDYVPLRTLFELTSVCAQWRKLLKPACARRTNVTLLVDFKKFFRQSNDDRIPFDIPCHEDLVTDEGFPQMTSSLNASLVGIGTLEDRVTYGMSFIRTKVPETFPNITHLKVVKDQANFCTIKSLTILLHHYSSKLISLNLCLCLSDGFLAFFARSQFECISSMSALTHLTLKYTFSSSAGSSYYQNPNPELMKQSITIQPPMPPSLKELSFYSEFSFDYTAFVDNVARSMPQLQRISISNSKLISPKAANPAQKQFIADSIPIGHRLTNFGFVHFMDNLADLTRIDKFVANFSSLTSLRLSIDKLPIREILPLTSLTRLVHLELIFRLNLRAKELPISPLDPQFTTLQVLELDFTNSAKPNLTQFCIGHTFPNIQVIRLDLKKVLGICLGCSKKHSITSDKPQCLTTSLQPLTQCTKLRKIYVNYFDSNCMSSSNFDEWTFPKSF